MDIDEVVSLEDEVLGILLQWSDEDTSDEIEAIAVVGTTGDTISVPKVAEDTVTNAM